MNILYIHQYFKTPSEGGAIRSYYIAKGLAEQGHAVEVITTHNNKHVIRKEIDGFTVQYLPVKYYNHYGIIRRVYAFLLFAHKAYYLSRKRKNIDLAYITSTPLTVALTALMLKKINGISYIFEIRDLWPEAPVQLGVIKNTIVKKISRKLELTAYRQADKIVTLSPGSHEYVSNLVVNTPVHLCPNISDCQFFEMSQVKDKGLSEKYSIGDALVITYFGAIGKINALEKFLDIVEVSENAKLNIVFFIIGEGAMTRPLKEKARQKNLMKLHFIPHLNKYRLQTYLSVTDAAFISFVNHPVMAYNSPNKFFDALAGGKIIISNTRGWTLDLIESNNCGFYVDPENPEEFISKIKPYLEDTFLRDQQRNARRLAEQNFEKEKLLNGLIQFIDR